MDDSSLDLLFVRDIARNVQTAAAVGLDFSANTLSRFRANTEGNYIVAAPAKEFCCRRPDAVGATRDELREAMLVTMYLTGPSAVIWSPMIDKILSEDEPLNSQNRT